MRLDSDILIDSALTHTRTQTHSHTHTTCSQSQVWHEATEQHTFFSGAPASIAERRDELLPPSTFLLPLLCFFYDVCQRQHRLQKLCRAGPKLSEVQQPSGKRSGHCGGRMMSSPSLPLPSCQFPPPTCQFLLSAVQSFLFVVCFWFSAFHALHFRRV